MFRNAIVKLILTFLVPFFVVAQVEHTGFLGGPFYGTVKDEKEAVTVQLGPTADLIMPNGLSAHSEQSRLSSGSSTALHASLLLDDGSHTVLNPESVEWTFSHPELQVKNSSLVAEVLSERKMVRVQASAEGFSTSFTVFILADEEQITREESEILPEALRSAIELEAAGWKQSEWFGVFYDARNGWIYHAVHGWIHLAEGGGEATWFWDEQNQWVWTGKNIYPHLYRHRDAAWLYFFKQALPKIVFYNYKTEKLERFAEK